jgi:hypothetical protein
MTDIIVPKAPRPSDLNNPKTLLDECINLATQYFTAIGELQNCPVTTSRRGGLSKCTCLHNLCSGQQDNALQKRVGTALVEFSLFSRDRRSEYLMTVIRYSQMPFIGRVNKLQTFVLPERDASAMPGGNDDTCSLPRPICQSALMSVLGIKAYAWRTARRAAESNVVPYHALKAKPSNNSILEDTAGSLTKLFEDLKEDTAGSLTKCFEDLKEHACPRATRVVQTHTEVVLQDDDPDQYELPTNWTKRAMFARWLNENSYDIWTDRRGVSIISEKADGDADCKSITWPTFRSYWSKNYPGMIIPRARADICGDCYVAVIGYRTNRSKHRSVNHLLS